MAKTRSSTALNTHPGQAIYNRLVLHLYDAWVLGISNRWAWQCPTPLLVEHFNRYLTDRHLDVGVGTGYYLAHPPTPGNVPGTTPGTTPGNTPPNTPGQAAVGTAQHRLTADRQVSLLDLNARCLVRARRRCKAPVIAAHIGDAYHPPPMPEAPFESISLFYLLHCLPGDMSQKTDALAALTRLLTDDGTLYGATILGQGVEPNRFARRLMNAYNRKGIFTNTDDDEDGLRDALLTEFNHVDTRTLGCVALFSARWPKR